MIEIVLRVTIAIASFGTGFWVCCLFIVVKEADRDMEFCRHFIDNERDKRIMELQEEIRQLNRLLDLQEEIRQLMSLLHHEKASEIEKGR